MTQDTAVTSATVELAQEQTLTIQVVRMFGRIPITKPKAIDVPADFRAALREWLDAAEGQS